MDPIQENTPADPTTNQSAALPSDGSGAKATGEQLSLDSKIDRASSAAIAQHLDEQPKRKPGQRGPDKRTRKSPVRLAQVADGTIPISMADSPETAFDSTGNETGSAFADEEAVKAVVEGLLEQINDMAAAFQRMAAMRMFNDSQLAEEAAKAARMSPKVETMIRSGGLLCLKKYAVDTTYAPEAAFFGGMAIWVGGNALNFQRMQTEAKRKSQTAPAPAP
jgi:hypothetical protein